MGLEEGFHPCEPLAFLQRTTRDVAPESKYVEHQKHVSKV